jgi:ribonuclease Z
MTTLRDYYFPNTEPLAADEMRVIALGTGRPFVRRGQANCSWLIELGNGDKFIMDFGSGSQSNFTALEIPHQDITAYFATHLHADHVGDFAQVWIGSWAGGRVKPLVLYGPSGPEPKYGTRAFCPPADGIADLGHRDAAWAAAGCRRRGRGARIRLSPDRRGLRA